MDDLKAALALAWEAGRDAAAEAGGNYMSDDADEALLGMWREDIRTLTPPAELSAALTARLDAEWNAAIEAAAGVAMHPLTRDAIRALRRAAPTEGEA